MFQMGKMYSVSFKSFKEPWEITPQNNESLGPRLALVESPEGLAQQVLRGEGGWRVGPRVSPSSTNIILKQVQTVISTMFLGL